MWGLISVLTYVTRVETYFSPLIFLVCLLKRERMVRVDKAETYKQVEELKNTEMNINFGFDSN